VCVPFFRATSLSDVYIYVVKSLILYDGVVHICYQNRTHLATLSVNISVSPDLVDMSSFRASSVQQQLVLNRTEGYLHKKGGAVNKGSLGGRRNWKKRWFVLETTTLRGGRETYELRYYESPKGKLKGTVDLQGTEIFCERGSQHSNKSVKFEFQILLQNGSMFNLSSDTFKERDEWIESLNYAITSMRTAVEKDDALAIIAGYDPLNEHKEEIFEVGRDIAQYCQVRLNTLIYISICKNIHNNIVDVVLLL
jgi:hypothetical protein